MIARHTKSIKDLLGAWLIVARHLYTHSLVVIQQSSGKWHETNSYSVASIITRIKEKIMFLSTHFSLSSHSKAPHPVVNKEMWLFQHPSFSPITDPRVQSVNSYQSKSLINWRWLKYTTETNQSLRLTHPTTPFSLWHWVQRFDYINN